VPPTAPNEAQTLAQATAADIAALSWEELDAYGRRDEQVVGKNGRVFRVKSHVFWDMDEWASGIQINVKVHAPAASAVSGPSKPPLHAAGLQTRYRRARPSGDIYGRWPTEASCLPRTV
jgi:hypothetical protein